MALGKRGYGGDGDQRGAAIRQLALLHVGLRRPLHLWLVVSDRWLRQLLAAVWSRAGLVAVRQRRLVHGAGIWLGLHRLSAVGLAALSLRRVGFFFPGLVAVGARLLLLGVSRVFDVSARGKGFFAVPDRVAWRGCPA